MDVQEEVMSLCAKVSSHETDVANLKSWQRSQNGHIKDINDKVDKLLFGILFTALAAVGSLVVAIVQAVR